MQRCTVRLRTEQPIRSHAEAHYARRFRKLDVRFRGALCYIDAWVDATTGPLHLCRLRFFGNEEAWSLAFYTYSHERYEPTFFPNGTFQGTPEEVSDVGAVYLQEVKAAESGVSDLGPVQFTRRIR